MLSFLDVSDIIVINIMIILMAAFIDNKLRTCGACKLQRLTCKVRSAREMRVDDHTELRTGLSCLPGKMVEVVFWSVFYLEIY